MTETNASIADLDDEERRASHTAARYAADADELQTFLSMLGLRGGTGSPPCRECGEPIARLNSGGYNRSAGDGLCARHFEAVEKLRRKAEREAKGVR